MVIDRRLPIECVFALCKGACLFRKDWAMTVGGHHFDRLGSKVRHSWTFWLVEAALQKTDVLGRMRGLATDGAERGKTFAEKTQRRRRAVGCALFRKV